MISQLMSVIDEKDGRAGIMNWINAVEPMIRSPTAVMSFTGKNIEAAIKTMNYCWDTRQQHGLFIGGTIDNPNLIDKEAGTALIFCYYILGHALTFTRFILIFALIYLNYKD